MTLTNRNILGVVLIVVVYCASWGVEAMAPCKFAGLFSREDLLASQSARDSFIEAVVNWEGQFQQNEVGYNVKSGLTYDGHQIDDFTGALYPPLHNFSAPSKESIHIGILARAINGDARALTFVNAAEPRYANAKEKAVEILTRKINSFEAFNRSYPGFGGFLPWVGVNDAGCYPIPQQWTNRVPGLDNGEMIWSLFAAAYALRTQGYTQLATRYDNYLNLLRDNVLTIFYAGDGRISAVTQIKNPQAAPFKGNYEFNSGWLDDPYEGELFAFFMDLYGHWANPADRESIWLRKRAKLVSVEYHTPKNGPITVQQGFWFSSHEQWKYMELPYLDVPINRRVFLNGERARTWHSKLNNIPGLFASVTDVRQGNGNMNYTSAMGIASIASQAIECNTTVTPYAAFPVILADQAVGLIWYDTMLRGRRMQNIYGSTESANIQGTAIAPVMTWDSKITTVLAMLGGLTDMNREVLKRDKTYDRFYGIVNREWSLKFPRLSGEALPFALPSAAIPEILTDFAACTR